MEFNPKTLRKFFLEALEQAVMPRFDSLDKEMTEMRGDMSLLQREMGSLQEDMGLLQREMGSLQRDMGLLQREMGSLRGEVDSIKEVVKRIDLRLLDVEEKIFPAFAEMKEQFELVLQKIEFLEKSGGSKDVLDKMDLLEMFTAKLKRELMLLTERVKKFESNLKQLRQSQKRRAAK